MRGFKISTYFFGSLFVISSCLYFYLTERHQVSNITDYVLSMSSGTFMMFISSLIFYFHERRKVLLELCQYCIDLLLILNLNLEKIELIKKQYVAETEKRSKGNGELKDDFFYNKIDTIICNIEPLRWKRFLSNVFFSFFFAQKRVLISVTNLNKVRLELSLFLDRNKKEADNLLTRQCVELEIERYFNEDAELFTIFSNYNKTLKDTLYILKQCFNIDITHVFDKNA